MQLQTKALTQTIGSQVLNAPRDLLAAGLGDALRELLIERGVLVFKQLGATPEEQVHLARALGELRNEGEQGIFRITLDKSTRQSADYLKGSFLWHMDGTHDNVPLFASLLTAVRLSAEGGQTEFANSYAAYDALPAATKARIATLQVVHSVETSMRRAGIEATPANLDQWRRNPPRTHQLVWSHGSGKRSLVIGCHASHVVGMDANESDELLQELLAWTTQPRFTYRHQWDVGDMLIWDNTGVLHRAEPYPADSGRLMHRTTLLGHEAFS